MKLPKQTAPVQRPSSSGAKSHQMGVEASGTALEEILKLPASRSSGNIF